MYNFRPISSSCNSVQRSGIFKIMFLISWAIVASHFLLRCFSEKASPITARPFFVAFFQLFRSVIVLRASSSLDFYCSRSASTRLKIRFTTWMSYSGNLVVFDVDPDSLILFMYIIFHLGTSVCKAKGWLSRFCLCRFVRLKNMQSKIIF